MRGASILLLSLAVLGLLSVVVADVYMHSPRGSNNRLNGENRERDNDNRLFDSQNNERGGYNVGSSYYYVNSTMYIEWYVPTRAQRSRLVRDTRPLLVSTP